MPIRQLCIWALFLSLHCRALDVSSAHIENAASSSGAPTTWTQLAELTASDGGAGDQLGETVAISGNTAVLGAPQAAVGSNNQEGCAYVYVKSAQDWKNATQVAKLTASDGQPAVHFGASVAISGNTIIVGEPYAKIGSNNNQGAAYVFVKPTGGWKNMTETAKLTASDGAVFDLLGAAVAIQENVVVAAAPFATIQSAGSAGAAYVFIKPMGGWKNAMQNAKLTASDPYFGAELGYAVSISGRTIAAGAPNYSGSGSGSVYVFVKAGSWIDMNQTAKLTASHGTNGDLLGFSASIDGSTIVAGAPDTVINSENYQGAAYVWVKPASGWKNSTQTARLIASDGAQGDFLGYAVSAGKKIVVAGAIGAAIGSNLEQGAAYVYNEPAKGWKSTKKFSGKLTASDGTELAWFGNSLMINANTLLVGAPGQTVGSNSQQGEAYIFQQ